ncbi:internal scaffolding protein [Peromfec virus RodF7_12]|uniref:Internal scaffolding protein n=1 Tax=Peromfec virus RodF7_12 TaxID=2929347 RepID=A0A976N386_9VIRU|nr:internal scaffolding protein [Peromfec virus RodF7_12]
MPSNFRTQYDKPARFIQEPGTPIKTLYGPKYDENGVLHLIETGKANLYQEIQSHADSVDIHVLLQRYQQGDVGVLARVQGAYGDFTQMPHTFAEALNTMIAAETYFMGLPKDTRAKFNNSFQQFIAQMDSPTWASDVGFKPPEGAPVPLPSQASPAASEPVSGPLTTQSVPPAPAGPQSPNTDKTP